MCRHNVSPHDQGSSPPNIERHHSSVILVGVLLTVTSTLGAQSMSPLKKPPVPNLGGASATMSGTRTPSLVHYDSPLSLERVPPARYPQTTLVEVHAPSNQLLNNGRFAPYRFSADAALFRKDKTWFGGTPDKPWAYAAIFSDASYKAQHRTEGIEHYIRHIPTAGPMIERICQHGKAHPHFTRALTIFRPDP